MEDSYARAGKACVRTAIAFPLLGGRCPRRGRMRVGIVGAEAIERADGDIRPYAGLR